MSLIIDVIIKVLTFNTFFTIYMTYLYLYDKEQFQETVLNITYFLIKTASYIQLYSNKIHNLYIDNMEAYILNEQKEQKEESDDDNQVENEEIKETVISYTFEFIKNNEIVYTTNKDEIINNSSLSVDFDFINCMIDENGVLLNKIFYEIPKNEEDLKYNKIDYNVRFCTIFNNNYDVEDNTSYMIKLVDEKYYFWIENNLICRNFLIYFLKKYYNIYITLDKLQKLDLQIITQDMTIHNIPLNRTDLFKILQDEIFEIVEEELTVEEEDEELTVYEEEEAEEEEEEDYNDMPSLQENSTDDDEIELKDEEEIIPEEPIKEEPIVEHEEPILEQEEPIKEEPIVVQEEPVQEEPIKEEPIVEHEEPILEQEEPIVEHEEPILEQEEPILEQEEPIVEHEDQTTEETYEDETFDEYVENIQYEPIEEEL